MYDILFFCDFMHKMRAELFDKTDSSNVHCTQIYKRTFRLKAYWICTNSSFIQYCDSNIG